VKILHVSPPALPSVPSPKGGAIQRRILELAIAQQQLKHAITVIAPRASKVESLTPPDGIAFEYVPVSVEGTRTMSWKAWYQIEVVKRIRQQVQSGTAPDVVHVHSVPELARVLKCAIPASKRPIAVLSFDNYFFRRVRGGLRPAFRVAFLDAYRRLLPCSGYCLRESAAYWGWNHQRLDLLPNGVNLRKFHIATHHREAWRRRLGVLEHERLLIYAGRMCKQKGTDILLESFARLRSRSDVRLVLVGPVASYSPAEQAVPRPHWFRLPPGASYIGSVSDDDLYGLLNASDLFVLPTRDLEMFGMAALEALACGLPVVATNQGGLPETVPRSAGLLVPPGDPLQLADALAKALRTLAGSTTVRAAAIEHARLFDWGKIAELSVDLYASTPQKEATQLIP
jgi:glycosyltransferase involved in cell wall biosynthesis